MDDCVEDQKQSMAHFLTAEELVNLRKNNESVVRPVVGEKCYSRSETSLEDSALQSSLQCFNDTLAKNRCARICDLIQAEWNETLNAVVVPKLKGKFVQHMGHMVEGKIVLSPEEAVFLLENGSIEIINGQAPMTTEEAYSTILVGNLGHEKYQVYSYLSQLGFVVVTHQKDKSIATRKQNTTGSAPRKSLETKKNELKTKLSKNKSNNKRKHQGSANEDSAAKRLNFVGVFPDTSEKDILPDVSVDTSDIDKEKESIELEKLDYEVADETDKCPSDIVPSLSANTSDVPVLFPEINPSSTSCDQNENTSPPVLEDSKKNIESDVCKENEELVKNSHFDLKDKQASEVQSDKNTETSVNVDVFTASISSVNENGHLEEVVSSIENEDKSVVPTSRNTPEEIVVMDIDSQSTELSCNVVQNSKDVPHHSSVKDLPQGANRVLGLGENSTGSNCDILSCSSSESDVLSVGVASDDSLTQFEVEDEVTLIEVKKKEIKPLAVIDLMSDDDDEQAPKARAASDDEIMVVSESSESKGEPAPPFKTETKRKLKSEEFSSPFHQFKSEGRSSTSAPPRRHHNYTVEFPRLHRRDTVCVSRPPLNLLPLHVKPAKEVYVLDLNKRNDPSSHSQGRLWNSFRDMQDYQRARRHNRNSGQPPPRFQDRDFRDSKSWNRNPYNQNSNGQSTSFDRIVSQPQSFTPSSWMGGFPQPPSFPFSNTNTIVGTRHQQVNVSMVQSLNPYGNQNFLPQGPGGVNSNYIRTVHSIASDVVSVIFNQHLNTFRPPNNGPPFNSNGGYRSYTPSSFNNNFSAPGTSNDNFYPPPRRPFRQHRGRPFPCHYNNAGTKRSWEQIKMSIGENTSENGGSDIEEVPITAREILWDIATACPLVQPGEAIEPSAVLKSLQITEKAKLTEKVSPFDRSFPSSSLEVSFDVYLPGFNYKKSCPDTPKHRIIVTRSTALVPKFGEVALLQKKWNDGASLQIAVVDGGDVTFASFTCVQLPSV